MLYSDTAKDGKQSRETSPPEVNPKGRGSKVVLSYIFYWRFNAIRLQFIRNNFCRGAIGPAYRSSNVAGAASGTRSFHPWYRRGKGILHPTIRNPILLSQEPVPVHFVIGCHRPGSQAFDPSFPVPHPIPAFPFRFCPDTPSASLLSVVPHTSRLFLPYTAPVPHFRFHSRFCSRPIPVSIPFLHLLLYQPPPVFILSRVLLTRSHPLPVSDRYHLWPDPKASVTATAKPWRRRKVGVM